MRVLVKPSGPNSHMTMEGMTAITVMINVEGIGPIDAAVVFEMRDRCKAVWANAIYELS